MKTANYKIDEVQTTEMLTISESKAENALELQMRTKPQLLLFSVCFQLP